MHFAATISLMLLGLFVLPVLVSGCLPDGRSGVRWYEARRDPTGLAPDPATTQEAVVQVYAARAVSWRGVFSVHTWIAVKPTGAQRYMRYEVLGFGVADGAPAVRVDRMGPDNYWFGARPQIVLDRRGPDVDAMIEDIRAAVVRYPYPQKYRAWPGPNSNTFTAYIARQAAKPSPPTSPSAMQRFSTLSNRRRNRSLSRKRPCRFFENVEWSGTAPSRPSPQNQRYARLRCTSSHSRRSERTPKQ
jgi:Protein of unknown function (DUF3750)